ncbi:MAG: Na+ dependent nucleoside transporter N-terminal domain-containing protein, partial [Saprospiraceae bacterium]
MDLIINLGRGILGMIALIAIGYIFSSNRKAIQWKTVGIGLAAQLLLALGVLKVPFIKSIFEYIGGIFVLILDFT